MAVLAAISAQASAQETVEPENLAAAEGGQELKVELNRLSDSGEGCQPYLLFRNHTGMTFSDLRLDLVLFDADGIVADRLAVSATPLPADKTSLIVFEIPSLPCDGIGSVLLNTVIACEAEPPVAGDCLSVVEVSSRLATDFFK